MRTKEQAKKSIDVWSRGGERQEKWSVVESLNIDVDLFLSKLELVNWNYWNYNLISILYVIIQTQKTIFKNSLRSTLSPHLETPQVDRIS